MSDHGSTGEDGGLGGSGTGFDGGGSGVGNVGRGAGGRESGGGGQGRGGGGGGGRGGGGVGTKELNVGGDGGLLADKAGDVGCVEPEGGGDVLQRGGLSMRRERNLGTDRGGVGSGETDER